MFHFEAPIFYQRYCIMSDVEDIAINHMIELLEKRDFKHKLVEELNKNIDLPMFDERTEKKIIKALYHTILESIREMNK